MEEPEPDQEETEDEEEETEEDEEEDEEEEDEEEEDEEDEDEDEGADHEEAKQGQAAGHDRSYLSDALSQSSSSFSVTTNSPLSDVMDTRAWIAAFRANAKLLPAPPQATLAPTSTPLCLHIEFVREVLLESADTSTYGISLSLFHEPTQTFFGRTYQNVAGAVNRNNGRHDLHFDCHLLWHTPITSSDVAIVLEVFSAYSNTAKAQATQQSLGWGMLKVDLATFHTKTTAGVAYSAKFFCPLWSGSPRLLAFGPPPFRPRGKAEAVVQLRTFAGTQALGGAWTHLIPEHTFMGVGDVAPGLHQLLDQGSMELHLANTFQLSISQLAVTLPAGYEANLLKDLCAAHRPLVGRRWQVTSRKMRMAVHTTLVPVDHVQEVELVAKTCQEAPESPRCQVARFDGTINFCGFIHHPACALLFEYVYELAEVTEEEAGRRIELVVGMHPFLPCRDDYIPYSGLRLVEMYLLSGPLRSLDGRPVLVTREPSAYDRNIIPIVNSPFYVTFSAQGNATKTRSSPAGSSHTSCDEVKYMSAQSPWIGSPPAPKVSSGPSTGLSKKSQRSKASSKGSKTPKSGQEPLADLPQPMSPPVAQPQFGDSPAKSTPAQDPAQADGTKDMVLRPVADGTPRNNRYQQSIDDDGDDGAPGPDESFESLGIDAASDLGVPPPAEFVQEAPAQALPPAPLPPTIHVLTPAEPLAPARVPVHATAPAEAPAQVTAPAQAPPPAVSEGPGSAPPPPAAPSEPLPFDPVGPYRGPASGSAYVQGPAVNQLPEPPVYRHSVHAFPLDAPLALTYPDRALLRRIPFGNLCDDTGHVILADEKGRAVHVPSAERIGSTGGRTSMSLSLRPQTELLSSEITIQFMGLITPRHPPFTVPEQYIFSLHFYNLGNFSSGPVGPNWEWQEKHRPKEDRPMSYPYTSLAPMDAPQGAGPALQVLWSPDCSSADGPAGVQIRLPHTAPTEAAHQHFLQYLRTSRLYVNVFDARTMFLYGRTALDLRPIARHADQSYCVHTEEAPVVACDEHQFQRADAVSAGYQAQQMVNHNSSELGLRQVRSQLVVRLANVGVKGTVKRSASPVPLSGRPRKVPTYVPKLADQCTGIQPEGPGAATSPTSEGSASRREARLKAIKRALVLAQSADARLQGPKPIPEDIHSTSETKLGPTSLPTWVQLSSSAGADPDPGSVSSHWTTISDKLSTIDVFRATHKQHTVRQRLREAITEERTLEPTLGYPSFLEVAFTSPFHTDHCFAVHLPRSEELQLVTSLEEWQLLCMAEGYPVPESDPPTVKAVYARGYAKVRVPLKFKSYTTPTTDGSAQQLTHEVSIRSSTGEEVRRLVLTIKPQAPVVHQSFQLYCIAAEALTRWLYVDALPGGLPAPKQTLGMQIGDPALATSAAKWIVCTDVHVKLASFVHRIECGGEKVHTHEYVEFKMPADQLKSPKSCYLILYRDVYMNQVWEVWHLALTVCHSKPVDAQVGCSNRILVPMEVLLRDVPPIEEEPTMQLAIAQSHPDVKLVSVQEHGDLEVWYHPKLPMHSIFYLNLVDQARYRTLSSVVIEIRATYPQPTRRWSESIPPLGRASLVRRIPFTNLYGSTRTFRAFTTSPQYLKLHPPAFALSPNQAEHLVLTFSNINLVGRWQFYVFVNTDDNDQTEECLEIILTVIDMKTILR